MTRIAARPNVNPSTVTLPLVNGDHLTRAEFERRYHQMSDVNKAQLIEGVCFMPSPVSISHGEPHSYLTIWMGTYHIQTPGTRICDNVSVRLDPDNMPQPDLFLRWDETHNGQSKVSNDDYLEGAPELIAEIAASSAAIDLHEKMHAYRRSGVKEYLVWRTYEKSIDVFKLVEGSYQPAELEGGIWKSESFPGLWLDVAAMLEGRMLDVLKTVTAGLAGR